MFFTRCKAVAPTLFASLFCTVLFTGTAQMSRAADAPDEKAAPAAKPEKKKLGATLAPPSETLIEQLGLLKGQGLVVTNIEADSIADKAGLKNHDVITKLGNKNVSSDPAEFALLLNEFGSDDKIDIGVRRKGKIYTVKGVIIDGPRTVAAVPAPAKPANKPGKVAAKPKVPPDWAPQDVTIPTWQNGCEKVARDIKNYIGGDIKRILPPKGMGQLGNYRGYNPRWGYHEVVVLEGRVYDAFTGSQGLSIEEYKALWDKADVLKFGF